MPLNPGETGVIVPVAERASDDVTASVAQIQQSSQGPTTTTGETEDKTQRERAATVIQKAYRGYRTRRELKGYGLDASTRWLEALKEVEWRRSTRPYAQDDSTAEESGTTQARRNWKRVANIAMHAGGDDNVCQDSPGGDASLSIAESQSKSKRRASLAGSDVSPEKTAKMMDLQYFLEMVDLKHRYGSHLRQYHNYWKNTPSRQNFFYWLDYGEGKDVELPRCSREQLDRDQVRYLTREERMNYLVTVDESGRFRWAKNGDRVSTDSSRFRDSIKGIVPIDNHTPQFQGHTEDGVPIAVRPSSSSSSSSADEEDDSGSDSSEEGKRYFSQEFDDAKGVKKLVYVSPAVIFNHLMRKSLKREDMWIFVADTSFRIYIGIKATGAFQHSSFLRGARIAAAGLIKVRDGQLRSLSPLSGHYRPPAASFRAFVHALQDQGVDMSRVSISRSYAVLVGIEGYTKTKRKVRALHEKVDSSKQKFHQRREENATNDDSDEGTTHHHYWTGGSQAEEEKQFLASTIGRSSDPQAVITGGPKGKRLWGTLKNLARRGSKDELVSSPTPTTAPTTGSVRMQGRGIPGTAPEEGVPPPEGKR